MEHLWTPWRMRYINEHKGYDSCVFCVAQELEDCFENLIIFRGEQAFVILNRYPYNNGHLMVVPNQHVDRLEDIPPEVQEEMMILATKATIVLRKLYHPHGFNLGINIGSAAGAGIAEHLHLHIVPRWSGDNNFVSVIGQTRVLPEELSETYQRIYDAWRE